MKRTFTPAFKAQVAVEALKEIESIAELSARFNVLPEDILKWKSEFIAYAGMTYNQFDLETENRLAVKNISSKLEQLRVDYDSYKMFNGLVVAAHK
jgi:transposase